VKWRKLGLRIDSENFGTTDDACRSDVGLPESFTAMGSRWRSWKGLRIGTSEDRIEDFHPNADWHGRDDRPYGWWLREAYTPIGDGGYYPGSQRGSLPSSRLSVRGLADRVAELGQPLRTWRHVAHPVAR
jgi:hypothetical protein